MADAESNNRKRPAPLRRPKRPDKAPKRERGDWLDAARDALVAKGIDAVKVEPLAKQLGVTTGSFYHHFKNRRELLAALLEHWEATNSGPIYEAVESAGGDPDTQFDALFETWMTESAYDPIYDSAVRAWAHGADEAAAAVRRVDDLRIALLKRIFLRFGYDEDRAFIRARVTYFHQVGYQAMEIKETAEQRRALSALYREILVGDPPGKT
ncbi:TetR/AcrR family transcriptional regulator [Sphingopyxis sp. 550A]|jgi:AcrR family transcriptional regulator